VLAALLPGGLAVVIAIALWWLRGHYAVVSITGSSMEPAFRSGDRVLVRRGRRPARGDIVVLERPHRPDTWATPPHTTRLAARAWIVKRIAAIPGDPMPAEVQAAMATAATEPRALVPTGRIVVLGDNPAASLDSRSFGLVPLDRVLGRAIRRLPRR